MSAFSRNIGRAAAIGALVLAAAPTAGAVPALASTQQLTPFRCFTQDDNVHVVFGPASFFTPPTQQGPTSFKENGGPHRRYLPAVPWYEPEPCGEVRNNRRVKPQRGAG